MPLWRTRLARRTLPVANVGAIGVLPRFNEGRVAASLLFPQVVIGAFLAFVPDNVLFVGTQLATALHVFLGVLTIPVLIVFGLRHARRLARVVQSAAQRRSTLIFVAAVVIACTTGVGTVFAYGRTFARLHTVFGIALALPLALHLLLARRRGYGIAAIALFAISVIGVAFVRTRAPQQPVEPTSPPFAYRLRPAALYDDSRWCADCHRAEYDTWARSTHARTLDLRRVREDYVHDEGQRNHRLTEAGAIVDGSLHLDGLPNNVRSFTPCVLCHAPEAYYSDAPEPLEEHAPRAGIGCVFCHTLRGVRQGHTVSEGYVALRRGKTDFDARSAFASRVDYVSAPETTRRYLFQNSGSALTKWIGNALIRWRPSMHVQDYGAAFLRDDAACRSCHNFAWTTRAETLNDIPPDPQQPRVEIARVGAEESCWSCHMDARNGVPPPGGAHLFLGGNAAAATRLRDDALATEEHAYGMTGPSLRIARAALHDGALTATIEVTSRLPHPFPTTTGESRLVWVRVYAVDAAGRTVADSQKSGFVPESLIVQSNDRMEPNEQRSFTATVPMDGVAPRRVLAELYHSFDPAPIARASSTID